MRTSIILMFFVIITNTSYAQSMIYSKPTNDPIFVNKNHIPIITKCIHPLYNRLNEIPEYGMYLKRGEGQLQMIIHQSDSLHPLVGVVTNWYYKNKLLFLEGYLESDEFIFVLSPSRNDKKEFFEFRRALNM